MIRVFLLMIPITVGAICPDGWSAYGNYCYLLSPSQWDFDTGQSVCKDRQADHVSFQTVEEREFIKTLVAGAREEFWIGAKRDANGNWIWTDGTTPGPNDESIRDWDNTAECPDKCTGDCVQINHWNGLWTNVPCEWSRRYICKRRNDIQDACDFEDGWHPYSGRCFKYIVTKKTWQDAEFDCVNSRGHLAILNTQEKFSILEEIIGCKDYEAGIWIGLSDTASPPAYMWVDNSPLTDVNWDTDQPKNQSHSGNNCVTAPPISNFKWRVDTCDRENEYSCERAEGTCSEGWSDYGTGYCYSVIGADSSFRKTWTDASHYCSGIGSGGQLIKIESDTQQNALKDIVRSLAEAGVDQVHIGLSDMQYDNDFRWSDGTSVIYSNFGNVERVTRRIDCGFVGTADTNATWNTGYCFQVKPFICQLPIHKIPTDSVEPSGWKCPDGWETDNRTAKCLFFSDLSVGYQQAMSSCSEGKFLVIQSADEQSFIATHLRGSTWIGYEYKEGRHQWYDNSPVTFENWQQSGFDNASALPCTVMSESPGGQWVNERCEETRYYICTQTASHVTATTVPPTPTAPWTAQCGSSDWKYNPSTQACYLVVNSLAVTWEGAHLACQDIGANLVSIHGEHETSFINGLLNSAYSHAIYWIGANDRDQNKGWQWSDGSPFFYWHWNDGEPNNAGDVEWCVELSTYAEGNWNDVGCDTLYSYICKKPSTTATVPPSVEPTKPPVKCDSPQPLLSGYHYIRDLGFSASSNRDGRIPSYSRLNHTAATESIGGSWTAGDGDIQPWLGVLFTHYVTVSGIITQGAGDKPEWVIEFKIMYLLQYGSFYDYVRNTAGEPKLFSGNTDSTTQKQNMFDGLILAHSIRIYPSAYEAAISMRFELLGCVYETCNAQPLVSGESMVPDDRMTASGEWDQNHKADRARLHYVGFPGIPGGWVANHPWTVDQWIQVEFDTLMTIYAIQTKGREDYPQWITKYKLLYSHDVNSWETYQEPYGVAKILPGNNDQNTLVTNWLNGNIFDVKFVRINPQEWVDGNSLRMDILGCHSQWYGCTDIPLITGENNYIPDSRLSSSTSLTVGTGPSQSRLNTQAQGENAGAWVPFVNDDLQWIQADLGRTQLVVGVATQGRQDNAMFITKFKLSHSNDGQNYAEYQVDGQTKLFPGNWDQDFIHKTYIDPTFNARYVKLHPVEWNVSIALRWEIYSCAGWAISSEVGCYQDNIEDRDLSGPSITTTPSGMTQEACIKFCVDQGYIYSGLQWGQECYCGNSYGRYGPSQGCTYPCGGDHTKLTICGGDLCNTIFRTGTFSSAQTMGCYSDAEDRDLPFEHYLDVPGGNTLDYCAMHCFNKGYRYAGAQFGSECYCGNSYGGYGPSTRCNMPCPGDHSNSTMCGGEWSNTVMSTGIAADEPRCRDGWIPYESMCYLFTPTRSTWYQARTNCHLQGSELATINNVLLNDFIMSQMALYDIEMWVGLHCLRENNYFEWASGVPVLFTNWNRREPNSAGQNEDCVMLYKNGLWNDDPCDLADRAYGYVCELPKEEIRDASTPATDGTCHPGWNAYRWKCYTAGLGLWIWSDAKTQCENLGGSLARIEDSQEQAFITSVYGTDSSSYWTDLSENNGQFLFSNGQTPFFTHWGQGQPADNGGSGCVIVNMTEYGMWQSISCTLKSLSICELARQGETRPSTIATQPLPGNCFNGWQPLGENHCFLAESVQTNIRRTWSNALSYCRAMGADLVSIHSIEEENQIRSDIMAKSGDFWIGLNAIDNNGGFVWSDGSPVDFEYWSGPGFYESKANISQTLWSSKFYQQHNRPSLMEDGKDCVDMYQATGTWNAIECTSLRNWICKIQKGIAPTVPTTTSAPSAGPPGSCDPDSDEWKFFNGRCYLFTGRRPTQTEPDTSEFNWYNAENACRQYGGHLVSLHTLDEQRFVEGQIKSMKIEAFNMWTGFTDMNAQQSWQWSDGTPTDFIYWEVGEPNNEGGMELCVAMEIHSGVFGNWSDKHCENIYPFICAKIPGGSTMTTPIPTPMLGYCPTGYMTYGNKCFKFVDEEVEWNKALEKCKEAGTNPYSIVSISDPWENAFLQSQLADRSYNRYWIGLYQYHGGNGEFGWIDNTPVTYTNWAGGEPNGALDEGCAEIFGDISAPGQWNDAVCSIYHPYICMRLKDSSITTPSPEPANDCPTGYQPYRGNCYRADGTTKSWQAAEDDCTKEGAHLASVENAYEMGFLVSQYRSVSNELWIGLSDQKYHGRYLWSDGSTTSYTYWGSGKPELTNGSCVYISHPLSGFWADSKCDALYSSICKITRVKPPYTQPPDIGICPSDNVQDNWIAFGQNCYLFRHSDLLNQADSGLACQTRKGSLASIHSDEENQFIYSHVHPNTGYSQWIGLLRSSSGEFVWNDGSPTSYFNWDSGEPNNGADGDENCVEMVMYSKKWNDASCKKINGYVCKKLQVIISNTTTGIPTMPPSVATTVSTISGTTPTSGTTPLRTTLAQTSVSSAKSTVIELPATTPVSSDSSTLSTSAIVGIVFGCVALGMILVFIGLMYLSRQRRITNGFNNPNYPATDSSRVAPESSEEGNVNFGADSTA